jgi:subtilisin-like proprotein convertase family protein
MTIDQRTGDLGCAYAWFHERCLRRIDSDKQFPTDLQREEHLDSQIFTGAMFEVVDGVLASDGLDRESCFESDACSDARDRILTTVLAANQFLTAGSTMADAAAAFLRANQVLFDGADADVIEAAFANHGLDKPGNGTVARDGTASATAKALVDIKIAHRVRGDLSVAIGVVDASFKPLCTPLTVLAPNPADAASNVTGRVDVSDTACAAFLPPSPTQQWVLAAVDAADGNVGEIDSFSVIADGVPFLATGVPQPIPDNDATGAAVLINGSGTKVAGQDQKPIESTSSPSQTASSPVATIAITHDNVGDLSVRAGVADASGQVLCSVPILDPDPSAETTSAVGDVDLGKCASLYPPSPDHRWFLQVIDTAAADEGTVDAFTITGPDGQHPSTVPVSIPDDDPNGVVLFVT